MRFGKFSKIGKFLKMLWLIFTGSKNMSYSGDVMDVWVDVEACMKFSFHFAPDRNWSLWFIRLMFHS